MCCAVQVIDQSHLPMGGLHLLSNGKHKKSIVQRCYMKVHSEGFGANRQLVDVTQR
jgi:hypothetical protein